MMRENDKQSNFMGTHFASQSNIEPREKKRRVSHTRETIACAKCARGGAVLTET